MKSLSPLGLLYALLAFVSWGVFPLYWKPFLHVSPWETLSHRVIWSLVVLVILVAVLRQAREVFAVWKNPRRAAMLFVTATLLSANWALFIYGVISGQVVQASLGYFLTPLVNILLACVVLKERLTRWQIAAVALASLGVLHYGWRLGSFPWIAIGIAITFGLYGLLRKVVAVPPLPGLLFETAWMTPVALLVLGSVQARGETVFGGSPGLTALFVGTGIVTSLPLFWFNSAAKLLPLSTMGFLQYIAPTLQLAVGVWVFHEPFTTREGVTFALIWCAIAIYLTTILRGSRVVVAPNPD